MSTKTPSRRKKQSEAKLICDDETRPLTLPITSNKSSLKSKSRSSKRKQSNPDNKSMIKKVSRSRAERKSKASRLKSNNKRKTKNKRDRNQGRRLNTRSSIGSLQSNRAESGRSIKRREMSKSSRNTKLQSSIMLERLDEERLLRAAVALDKAPKSRGRLEQIAAREKEKEAIIKNAKVTRTQPSQPKLLSCEPERSRSKRKRAVKQPFFRLKTGSKRRTISKLRTKSPSSSSNQQLYVMDESEMFKVFRGFLKEISPKKHLTPKSRKPVQSQSKDTVIENDEMLEILYDELVELFSNFNTLQNSYHDIVNSLVTMQKKSRRRSNKRQQLLPIPSDNFESSDQSKYSKKDEFHDRNRNYKVLEKYMNPKTRDNAFKQLFQRVERFKSSTQNFRACFDQDGHFIENKYQNYIKKYGGITFHLYAQWHSELRDLEKIVSIILQEYNREVLELFRLSITQSQ